MTEKKGFKLDWATLKLAVILFAFSAVVAILLGLTNQVTCQRIADSNAAKTRAAMAEVLQADSYEEVAFTDDTGLVKKVYRAGDAGFVVMVTPSGFGGDIEMAVGMDPAGSITGLSIISMSESSGLGANASRESFRDQFKGLSGSVALSKQGGEIDALTGATVTSTAVVRGVNAALAAVSGLR